MNINYPYIIEYIRNTISHNDEFLHELESYANKNNIPIVQLETAKLLSVLCRIKKPKCILEIGTAIGYSAILMARSSKGAKITTLEQDDKMIKFAKSNIKNANLENNITILEGPAEEVLDTLNGTFDLIFIDASKSHYMEFFDKSIKFLNADGIVVADNILFKGMIANDELVNKRDKTITKRMREYLDYICNHKDFETSIIPIGDGAAISVRIDN